MMKGWHFLREDGRLGYGDNRKVKVGQVYTCKGDIRICCNGMHASKVLHDALQYAPGPVVCRVNVTGDIVYQSDKFAGRNRKVLWMFNMDNVLRRYARLCALDVLHLWEAPDIVREYLETGDESIRAAAEAALAARDAWGARAAWGATWAAARAAGAAGAARAAWAARAARAAWGAWGARAAWAAARDAGAAGAAARAARAAAVKKQQRRLTAMVIAEAKRLGVYVA